jgi:hypothetical protein
VHSAGCSVLHMIKCRRPAGASAMLLLLQSSCRCQDRSAIEVISSPTWFAWRRTASSAAGAAGSAGWHPVSLGSPARVTACASVSSSQVFITVPAVQFIAVRGRSARFKTVRPHGPSSGPVQYLTVNPELPMHAPGPGCGPPRPAPAAAAPRHRSPASRPCAAAAAPASPPAHSGLRLHRSKPVVLNCQPGICYDCPLECRVHKAGLYVRSAGARVCQIW